MSGKVIMRLLSLLIFSTLSLAQVEAPPISDPVPTPYPGPSALQVEINQVRVQYNLPQVVSPYGLDCAAVVHAVDLASHQTCSHIGSDGSTLEDRVAACQSTATSEWIACGFHTSKDAMAYFLSQPEFKNKLIDSSLLAVGTARAKDVWVVVFLSK
jgi:uncharacterized protein YkwD